MPVVTMNMPDPPEGFEYTCEYRLPKAGEWYAAACAKALRAPQDHRNTRYPILRKTQKWRNATIEDLKRCPVPCRVRDDEHQKWITCVNLVGWIRCHNEHVFAWVTASDANARPALDDCSSWRYCQVLDT